MKKILESKVCKMSCTLRSFVEGKKVFFGKIPMKLVAVVKVVLNEKIK